MDYAAFGVRINPTPRGWMDRAQLPDAAEHVSTSRLLPPSAHGGPSRFSLCELHFCSQRQQRKRGGEGQNHCEHAASAWELGLLRLTFSLDPKAFPSCHRSGLL